MTFATVGPLTTQAVTGTIGPTAEGHYIPTVDWMPVHFPHGSDLKPHVTGAGGPMRRGNEFSRAGIRSASSITSHPVLRLAAGSVGQSQSNGVTAIDDGISTT